MRGVSPVLARIFVQSLALPSDGHWHSVLMRTAARSGTGLVSIGYEGRDVKELVELLCLSGVRVLADVRLTPLSRKPGLSRRALETALDCAGIEYRHFRALGNPRENRPPFREGRIEEGCARFETLLEGPEAAEAIAVLRDLSSTTVVAVLCFERDHDRCHRQVVIERLVSTAEGQPTVLYV